MAFKRLFCSKSIQLIFNNSIEIISASNYQRQVLNRTISTSQSRYDLMGFFDDKANWGSTEVKTGRSWTKDELRLKSNADLHKLWYILLKEKNMLLTMEEECNSQVRLFASPERTDKVEDSMENLETVVRERNRAYFVLETGETGERTTETVENQFGLATEYKPTEHLIPKEENEEFLEKHKFHDTAVEASKDVLDFKRKMMEKENLLKRRAKTRDFNHVIKLLNRFPEMDMEALKEKYPDVDIEKAKNHRKCHVHWQPS